MSVRDDRFDAFIVERTSSSRSRIRRVRVHKRWLKVSLWAAAAVLCASFYGLYGLTQHVMHLRIEHENERLRVENEAQRQQLNQLNNRVEAVEDASRRLVEMSGVDDSQQKNRGGTGGPAFPLDSMTFAAIEHRTHYLERNLQTYEALLRERERVPSLWPVEGAIESVFGGRRSPFGGGSSFEFHTGQD